MAQRKVESPFVGLVPYTEQDAPFFFGRERDQQRILANLFASRLTILYGASGVGKSSVLRAGIVNEVRQRIAQSRALGEAPEIAVVYFKDWKGDVLAQLRTAISAAMLSLVGRDYLEGLAPSLPLDELLVQAGTRFGGDLLLILDQFEEYFLYRPAGAPDDFATQFAAAANRPGLPANFVLSLRDDSIARLDRFKPLIPNLFANYLRIYHLTGEGAHDAILKPVEHYNELSEEDRRVPGRFTVEPELVKLVIEQAHTGRVLIGQVGQGTLGADAVPDAVETPYFQLVMTRLWREEVERASHVLRASTLRELGGAETIIKSHLENALSGLSGADRDICARLFPHLVTPSGSKIAHTALNLAKYARSTPEPVELLLKNLAGSDKRILSVVAPPDGRLGEEQYEIYHDSLAQAVLAWQARYDAQEEAKVRAQAKHRVLVVAVALGIAFVIAAAAAGFAAWQYKIAETERSHAVQAWQRAEKAEADALLLKSQADKERLLHEQADAQRQNNANLVAVLQSQIDSVKKEESQYKQQVAARPGSESKGPTIADVIRERDTLREKLVAMEKQAPEVNRREQYQASPTPAQTTPPQVKPAPRAPEPAKENPSPAKEIPVPVKETPAVHAPVKADTVPSPRTLILSRILSKEDGSLLRTLWTFEIFAIDAKGTRTSIGKLDRIKIDDKKAPIDLNQKLTLPAGTGAVVIAGRREDNPLLHTTVESVATNLLQASSVSIPVRAKDLKRGDFLFTVNLQ